MCEQTGRLQAMLALHRVVCLAHLIFYGHMQINSALEEEMKSIHALSIRQCWTPEQQKAKQPS